MMRKVELQIREWFDGETLDSLIGDEIVRMCDYNSLLGDFIGLYHGIKENRYILLSRDESSIRKWKLSGNGLICGDDDLDNLKFLFDGDEEDKDYSKVVDQEDEGYLELNKILERNNM